MVMLFTGDLLLEILTPSIQFSVILVRSKHLATRADVAVIRILGILVGLWHCCQLVNATIKSDRTVNKH